MERPYLCGVQEIDGLLTRIETSFENGRDDLKMSKRLVTARLPVSCLFSQALPLSSEDQLYCGTSHTARIRLIINDLCRNKAMSFEKIWLAEVVCIMFVTVPATRTVNDENKPNTE